MEWLRTFGPLMVDFSIPKILFTYHDNEITITGDPKSIPSPSSYNQLFHILHTDFIAYIHLLIYQPSQEHDCNSPQTTISTLKSLPISLTKQITSILKTYATIFQTALRPTTR